MITIFHSSSKREGRRYGYRFKVSSSNINNINYEQANLNPKYKFDTFIVGNNNKFPLIPPVSQLRNLPEMPTIRCLSMADAGLGKTHLMHSIGHFILEQNPNMKVLYVTSESFYQRSNRIHPKR